VDSDARPPPLGRPRPPRGPPPRRTAREHRRTNGAGDDRGGGDARLRAPHRPGGARPALAGAARGARARLLRRPHPERARRAARTAGGHHQEPDVRRPLPAARPARRSGPRAVVPVETQVASALAMSTVADSLKGRSFTRVAGWSRDELLSTLDLADDLKERQRRREE